MREEMVRASPGDEKESSDDEGGGAHKKKRVSQGRVLDPPNPRPKVQAQAASEGRKEKSIVIRCAT